MKSIKSKILVFLSFLFSIFFVGSAFSAYIFSERTNLHTDKAEGLMDDILNNYELDANSYTVYFFPSSKWANYIKDTYTEATPLKQILSVDNYRKYIGKIEEGSTSDDTLKKYGYFDKDENPFGYKSHYEDSCISLDTFSKVSDPLTTNKDKYGYLIRFSGWTADFENACIYGYDSQGTYDYISSYDELSKKSTQSIYSTLGLSKTIFVFPVLTAGKDYDKENEDGFNGQTVVRIHDRDAKILSNNDGSFKDMYFGRELYFSQTKKDNDAYYFYKNLKVNENERSYLDCDIKMEGEWINFSNKATKSWYETNYSNSQVTKSAKWDGEVYDGEGTSELTPLFDTRKKGDTYENPKENDGCAVNDPGVYNIYVYVCKWENENAPSGFNDKLPENSPLVWFEDSRTNNNSVTTIARRNKRKERFSVYVKIEKIYEIGLSGGRTKSLSYTDSLQMNKSDITTDSNKNANARYFLLNNVFLEGKDIDEKITSYNKETGLEYTYPSSASVILTNEQKPIKTNIGRITDDTELSQFNVAFNAQYGSSTSDHYDFTDSNNVYNFVVTAGDLKHISNLPFSYRDSDSIFIQPQKSGFYSIVAKVTMKSEQVGSNRYCNLTIDSCNMAIALGRQVGAQVYLYEKDVTINRAKGDKFIETSTAKGNWYANADIIYGQPLTYSTEFKLKDGSKKTLSEILGVTGTTAKNHLTNHLTGREFKFNAAGESIQLRRNYAFYIMPDPWREGEINWTV